MTAYAFLMPFLAVLAVFFFYAFGRAVYYSFSDFNLFNTPHLIGLKPYGDVLSDTNFRRALTNTLLYAVITTVLQTVFALLMAVVLNRRLRGLAFFRAAWYMPSITSSVVITLIFLWLFQRRGAANYLFSQLGAALPVVGAFLLLLVVIQAVQVAWERSRSLPARALDPALLVVSALLAGAVTAVLTVTGVLHVREAVPLDYQYFADRWVQVGGVQVISVPMLVIIAQNVFTTVPTLMLFFLAGLQGVPGALYEAAEIDGATPVQQFLNVTVPMLRPVTFYVVTVGLIGTLQMFDQVAIIGSAAPQNTIVTLAYYVYRNTFQNGVAPVNLASAAAILLALITLALVFVQRRFFVAPESGS
ncbi:carbohydrate ABC transporter permease [Deinococcus aquiradiocola]|uniref:ABC transporter permease n=1 Tax=Deinococcus aquiradiocola TaxID=393059 RepID=A0A917ULV5_9DEIO|nr:sugar ABC transporter permease [Deinococcus aquiradiocola]GGJ67070.1 ABC transporter permease [Deinococcus aquiradiocola]